jgi:hypothetical protein
MQEDIEYLSKGLDYVMNMLISKDKHENHEVSCSPYEYDTEVEEIHVNKLQSHEIKEVRIETDIPSAPNPTPMMIPVEADIIPAPISISKSESVVPDDTEVETEDAAGVEEDDEDNKAYVGVEGAVEVQGEAEDEEQGADEVEEEEAEEEEEGIDVEEFEYKGTSYYKDPEGNVYECLESGEVGEPVGTMSKKIPGKVLFYS